MGGVTLAGGSGQFPHGQAGQGTSFNSRNHFRRLPGACVPRVLPGADGEQMLGGVLGSPQGRQGTMLGG